MKENQQAKINKTKNTSILNFVIFKLYCFMVYFSALKGALKSRAYPPP
jgi:hypothetical protein